METIIINKRALTALLVVLLFHNTFAQNDKSDKILKRAKKYYEIGYSEKARELYREVLQLDSANVEANYYHGVTIIEDSNQKWESLDYLLIAYHKDSLFDNKMDYYLGMAYQYNNSFEEAIPFFINAEKKISPIEKSIRRDISERIEQCKVGIELSDSKKEVVIENLGPKVNSPSDDYAPVYSPANEKIIFTSDRKGSKRSLLDMLAKQSYDDIYEVKIKDDAELHEAQNLGNNLNTKYHDSGLAIDYTGSTMLVYHSKNNGDIYMSEYINGQWSDPINLGDNINTPEYLESSATLSPDGRSIYFTSSRPGGYGGTDIYVCERDENNKWGEVRNLGSEVNTEGEEEAPYISSDGSTLYFSSTGHKGIGGFDIFYSERDPISGMWTSPKNLGIPVNTPQDDIYFVLSQDGKNGYFSAIHRDTYGGKDIYRVSMVDDDYKNATLLANSNLNPQTQGGEESTFISSAQDYYSNEEGDDYEKSELTAQSGTRNPGFDLKELMRNIYFDTDNNNIRKVYHEKLDQLVAYLEENQSADIEISGHSDIIGNKTYNLALSIKRAESVRQYLVDQGVEATRLVVKGYGSNIPLASNDDEQNGRALNRRVELDLIENDLVITSLAN